MDILKMNKKMVTSKISEKQLSINQEQTLPKVWDGLSVLSLFLIFIYASLLRIVFFTGVMGSDDLVYLESAIDIANGVWQTSHYDYCGAIRYGFNIPVAILIKIFGTNEFSLNLWPFICSIGEVVLVFILARLIWGLKTAILSSIIIASLPLHVSFAGRVLADAPLAFFITLSFFLFYIAEKQKKAFLYLFTGLTIGFVFWIKEVVSIYAIVFLIYGLIQRKWRMEWFWLIIGSLTMISVNCFLFWLISGDFFHLFKIIPSRNLIVFSSREYCGDPWYYFRYMFFDGRHTWLMPYLALLGLAIWVKQIIRKPSRDIPETYIIIWAISLVLLFSFLVVSVNPLRFIMKQTNYMLIFMSPLSLLAGYFLMRSRGAIQGIILPILIAGSIILSALEQQAIRVFTSNSKAAVTFAKEHPKVHVYGTQNAVNVSDFMHLMKYQKGRGIIRSFSELAELPPPATIKTDRKPLAYVIIDWETIDWGKTRLKDIPDSWQKVGSLQPTGFGIGKDILYFLRSYSSFFPKPIAEKIVSHSNPYLNPKPADIYQIPKDAYYKMCTF